MRKDAMIGVLAAGALLAGGCSTSSEARRVAGDPDEYFMVWAAESNLAEIATGEMAASEAANEQVRDFGEQMVESHRQANEDLHRLAKEKGIDLPKEPDQAHMELARHLQRLDGEAFDREYIGAMVADHAKALEMFEGRAETASDPQLRAWARQMVPVLEEHLQQARMLQRELEMMSPASTRDAR